jgi:hypothetical protein
MPALQFKPKRGSGDDARLRHIEDYLSSLAAQARTDQQPATPPSSSLDLPIPESSVTFDPDAGHEHNGSDSHTVDHANLTNVTSDQHHPKLHQADHQSGGADALTGLLDATARVKVAKAGSVVGTRREINLIEGTGITITESDDSGNEKVDVTITASAGAGGTGLLGAWVKQDITNLLNLSPGDELYTALSKGANDTMSIVMDTAGQATGITAFCSGSIGGGIAGVHIVLYKNGVATSLSCSVATSAYKGRGNGSVSYAADDELTLFAWRNSGENAVRMTCYLWGGP